MTLESNLARLEDSQLVRRTDDMELSYLFKHTLSQETAYGSLLVKKRREIHLRVAESIELIFADRLDEYAAILAQHFAETGEDDKTIKYAIRAGDAGMRVYANSEAAIEYSLALDVARRGNAKKNPIQIEQIQNLFLKRGRAFELQSKFDDAARNYDEMETAALASGDRAFELASLIAQATIHSIPGSARDPEQAQTLSERALGLARELGDRKAEAKILWNMLLLNIYSGGDAKQAVLYGEQSLAIARDMGLREQMAYTLNDLFVAYSYLGQMDKAGAVRSEASGLWRELGNQPMLAESLSGLGMLQFLAGDFDRALALAREAFQISQSIGNIGGVGFSGYALGLIYFEKGLFGKAIESINEAIPITLSGGLEGNGISPYAMLGLIHACLGDYAKARDLLRTTFLRESAKLPLQKLWLYAILTRVELSAGDTVAAGAAFHGGAVVASIENFSRIFPLGAPQLYFAECEIALAQNERDRALGVIESLLAHLREIKMRAFIPEALYLKGRTQIALGEREKACKILREAKEEAEAIGSTRILWQVLVALAQLTADSGNGEEANKLLDGARSTVQFISDNAPTELRASFNLMPEVLSLLKL